MKIVDMKKPSQIAIFVLDKLHAAIFCAGIGNMAYFRIMLCFVPEQGTLVPLVSIFFTSVGAVVLFVFVCKWLKRYIFLRLLVYLCSWLFILEYISYLRFAKEIIH